ncbi:putative histidine kinase [Copromyces sp. CBS 386.78]|nr:putative histidine kinase [Copromyces sp. CBS 386.78]
MRFFSLHRRSHSKEKEKRKSISLPLLRPRSAERPGTTESTPTSTTTTTPAFTPAPTITATTAATTPTGTTTTPATPPRTTTPPRTAIESPDSHCSDQCTTPRTQIGPTDDYALSPPEASAPTEQLDQQHQMTGGVDGRGGLGSLQLPTPQPRAPDQHAPAPFLDDIRSRDSVRKPSRLSSEVSFNDSPNSEPSTEERQLQAENGKRTVGDSQQSKMDPSEAQRQLSQYRLHLAREMEKREIVAATENRLPIPGPARVSPIQEEASSPSPQLPQSGSEPTTTSTESGNTIRGGVTPGLTARTPSYPFPRMVSSPGFPHIGPPLHRPFTTLSPTTFPNTHQSTGAQISFAGIQGLDHSVSNPSTPASAMTFLPQGCSGTELGEFATPNLYDLTLMLSAEPGLDAWWHTVVQIMTEVYRAERVTLAVPADSTDIENVPWGQKATYNAHQEDGLSLGYLARGSSFVHSSTDDITDLYQNNDESPKPKGLARPGLPSRHSFSSFEDNKDKNVSVERAPATPLRPPMVSRSKTTHPGVGRDRDVSEEDDDVAVSLNREALAEHDALEGQQPIPSWEAPITNKREGHGKLLNVLQALDYEADPLLDHNGVLRVLERGRVVALTRTYPYLAQTSLADSKAADPKVAARSQSPEGPRRKIKKIRTRSESTTKLSALLGSATLSSTAGRTSGGQGMEKKATGIASRLDDEHPRPPTPKYEEYEQAPPSPWSQSPAPSPAVRADPSENPFFTDAMVDEESFNPGSAPPDYSALQPPEAIGVDNSWTVLHIPLTHVLLSKPQQPGFKLDSAFLEQKMSQRGKSGHTPTIPTPYQEPAAKEKHAPIAILSILSPIIPYPSNLRHSLEHLAPHLATSFSLCRHYTNLETELNGLQKRRPQTVGFGALGPDGRPLADPTALTMGYLPTDDNISQQSHAGSITSPSEYSGPSRSTIHSPNGTPTWDPSALSHLMDKRSSSASPAPIAAGDSYFTTKPKSGVTVVGQRAKAGSREGNTLERKGSLKIPGGKSQWQDAAGVTPVSQESQGSGESTRRSIDESSPANSQQKTTVLKEQREERGSIASSQSAEFQRRKPAITPTGQHRHTQLHSYGADFATTFQSLPPSSTVGKGISQGATPSRQGSISSAEMTPPSDKLKGLILDSLPAHVFVALPQTGEIVWVNSRFLTYRGQTSGDLAADPWGSIHPDDRDDYLRKWSASVRTGEQFSTTVRIRRFDGAYRYFYARAVASKDKRGVILQFLGSYMDIHDQHVAELRAARQEEIEVSEAKHRLLANLIPQIIFTATEDEGITFANEQWLSYTGQSFDDVLGLGFMDFVHPEDLAKCRIPLERPTSPHVRQGKTRHDHSPSPSKFGMAAMGKQPATPTVESLPGLVHPALTRHSSSASSSANELAGPNLSELARQGVIKISTDSKGQLSYTTEIRLRSKSGEYRWHLIRCVEIDNVDFGNGASSYFGSATDINDLKLLETKLKEAMESKSRFLSNMSHEIRTPLIGISGMVSFLQDTTLNEEQRDYTNTIQTSANSLIMIINDILDLSKVDAGMMKLNYEWFHTRSLIEDVNELVSTMAIAKRLELNYVVEEDVPAWVKGDKVRIRQVLLNVIGNAIKFTNEGEVFSRCKVVIPDDGPLHENEIMLEFSIIDTGRGFTKEEAELIFKPFSQIDGSSTRQHGGSGLGLVISRQLVELHGGKMDGTAVPGKGSTFTFTARFGLPTESDNPDLAAAPAPTPGLIPEMNIRRRSSLVSPHCRPSLASAPSSGSVVPAESDTRSPAAVSTSSSEPSIHSSRTQTTERSSMSSVNVGSLARFSEAARASGHDLSQMKLEMPHARGGGSGSDAGTTPTPSNSSNERLSRPTNKEAGGSQDRDGFHAPLFSILIICPQTHSREATTKHIEMTLPKDNPHQITAVASVQDARKLIGGEDPVFFTHVVVNLPTPEQIIELMDEVQRSSMIGRGVTILILSDSVQRQAVLKQVTGTQYEDILSENRVTYIYKPVKPSRFAVIFDPAKERDLSIDRNRSTAEQLVENQKQSYLEVEKRMGNKGYKVLLVEDNLVNQKVLQKYLKKVGVDVELVADGVECTDVVFSRPHDYFSLILCDLHMPRKDGYQACREIREWEAKGKFPGRSLPIIALSANVMSDVQDKCLQAGFNDYVTKPVDFINLSNALSRFF